MGEDGTWESNATLRKKLKIESVATIIGRRKAAWIGHLARREDDEQAENFLKGRDNNSEHNSFGGKHLTKN